jgi:23S rRNA (adenine1618-N6)-methyltransferase
MKPNLINAEPKLHNKNLHQGSYDFDKLILDTPDLQKFVISNPEQNQTIDFHDSKAVKTLNKALLKTYYNITGWDIPSGYLCPPIPGRADYIHHLADLITPKNKKKAPRGPQIKVIDIGTGANCIYSLLGASIYNWSFLSSDIDSVAIKSAQKILDNNPKLNSKITLKHQPENGHFFKNIIQAGEFIDLTLCNPPFHKSLKEAQAGTERKNKNLKASSSKKSNFKGQNNELWCEGGELKFIENMILESQKLGPQCAWFTSLVSKESNLKALYAILTEAKVAHFKTIEMGQGNKKSRIVAWTFLKPKELNFWAQARWN